MSASKIDKLVTREKLLETKAVDTINEVIDDIAAQDAAKKDKLAITFTNGNMADGTGAIAVTIADQDGDPVDALVTFWGAATALGAATGTSIGNLAVGDDGELVAQLTEHIAYMAVTDGGALDVTVTGATTDKFLNVAVGSQVASHKFTVAA